MQRSGFEDEEKIQRSTKNEENNILDFVPLSFDECSIRVGSNKAPLCTAGPSESQAVPRATLTRRPRCHIALPNFQIRRNQCHDNCFSAKFATWPYPSKHAKQMRRGSQYMSSVISTL